MTRLAFGSFFVVCTCISAVGKSSPNRNFSLNASDTTNLPSYTHKITVKQQIPPVDTVVAAIEEWRGRWPTRAPFPGAVVPPLDELEQMPWNLGKGFDVIANQLGGMYYRRGPVISRVGV